VRDRTESDLVAVHDIRPGNGADLFFSIRSPQGALVPRPA